MTNRISQLNFRHSMYEAETMKRRQERTPRCGDIWKLKNGEFLLVDYVYNNNFGYTLSNGYRGGCNFLFGFIHYVKDVLGGLFIISTWENAQERFPWSDCFGYTEINLKGKMIDPFSKQDALSFLKYNIIKYNKEQEAEMRKSA